MPAVLLRLAWPDAPRLQNYRGVTSPNDVQACDATDHRFAAASNAPRVHHKRRNSR